MGTRSVVFPLVWREDLAVLPRNMAELQSPRGVPCALLLLALLLASAVAQVDVQFPFGRVNVNKTPSGTTVDVQHPAGRVHVDKAPGAAAKVDVTHPAGTVNVNKGGAGGTVVDVQHPAGRVHVGGDKAGASSSSSSSGSSATSGNSGSVPAPDLLAVLRSILNNLSAPAQQQRAAAPAGSKDVNVNYPGGLVNVRKAVDGRKQVDVKYPGGSVNVGNNGNNVDVAFPGGYVKLDPKEPGQRRTGVVVFPFGSVRFG
ncbi:Catalase-peroxidase [Frankliniella fusca]|uniref:Catalase-peroxidase n=1 Tax=Frankliniella fusca TaxID=407009 RepID=A0AAE1LQE8_9NEOP|nr:Catalase-peroxidase [Frankliniella fusca]